MSGVVNESVECSSCGFVFQGDKVGEHPGEHEPCPNCGSLMRHISLTIKETWSWNEYNKLKAKKLSNTHKKHRADYEFEEGKKIGKDGKLVYKRLVKDRENTNSDNSYQELVIDVKTGDVVVDKHEKLSKHGGEVDK
jgi:predicted RNA-binding Zn-ribbon protein involved in translation (DUF1610 family)